MDADKQSIPPSPLRSTGSSAPLSQPRRLGVPWRLESKERDRKSSRRARRRRCWAKFGESQDRRVDADEERPPRRSNHRRARLHEHGRRQVCREYQGANVLPPRKQGVYTTTKTTLCFNKEMQHPQLMSRTVATQLLVAQFDNCVLSYRHSMV